MAKKFRQAGLFDDTHEDLALFSGTPPTVEYSEFTPARIPQPEGEQLTLTPEQVCPDCGGPVEPYGKYFHFCKVCNQALDNCDKCGKLFNFYDNFVAAYCHNCRI